MKKWLMVGLMILGITGCAVKGENAGVGNTPVRHIATLQDCKIYNYGDAGKILHLVICDTSNAAIAR